MQTESKRTTLAIDGPTFERLAEVARRNERSASAEARLAIRNHLEKSESPASRAQGSRDVTDGESSATG